MDSMSAFIMGQAARRSGQKMMVFDWDKAARRIKESQCCSAGAGLAGDWDYTGGEIYRDGAPVLDDYTYLASIWATPEIKIDGVSEDCFIMAEDSPGWDSSTKWPQSAIDILNG